MTPVTHKQKKKNLGVTNIKFKLNNIFLFKNVV